MVTYTTRPCMWCGQRSSIAVDEDKYDAWVNGTLVQDAFPDWTPELRELLITGTHPDCWDKMFPLDDE